MTAFAVSLAPEKRNANLLLGDKPVRGASSNVALSVVVAHGVDNRSRCTLPLEPFKTTRSAAFSLCGHRHLQITTVRRGPSCAKTFSTIRPNNLCRVIESARPHPTRTRQQQASSNERCPRKEESSGATTHTEHRCRSWRIVPLLMQTSTQINLNAHEHQDVVKREENEPWRRTKQKQSMLLPGLHTGFRGMDATDCAAASAFAHWEI